MAGFFIHGLTVLLGDLGNNIKELVSPSTFDEYVCISTYLGTFLGIAGATLFIVPAFILVYRLRGGVRVEFRNTKKAKTFIVLTC